MRHYEWEHGFVFFGRPVYAAHVYVFCVLFNCVGRMKIPWFSEPFRNRFWSFGELFSCIFRPWCLTEFRLRFNRYRTKDRVAMGAKTEPKQFPRCVLGLPGSVFCITATFGTNLVTLGLPLCIIPIQFMSISIYVYELLLLFILVTCLILLAWCCHGCWNAFWDIVFST